MSSARINALKDNGARVLTKSRAERPVPEKVQPEPVVERETVVTQQIDVEKLAAAIRESNKELMAGVIAAMPRSTVQRKVKSVHIGNIERDARNRIESADMGVTYE